MLDWRLPIRINQFARLWLLKQSLQGPASNQKYNIADAEHEVALKVVDIKQLGEGINRKLFES